MLALKGSAHLRHHPEFADIGSDPEKIAYRFLCVASDIGTEMYTKDPRSPDGYILVAYANLLDGDVETAKLFLIMRRNSPPPGDWQEEPLYIVVQYASGKISDEDIRATVRRILDKGGVNPSVYARAAIILRLIDSSEALPLARMATTLDNNSSTAYLALYGCLIDCEQFDEARAILEGRLRILCGLSTIELLQSQLPPPQLPRLSEIR